MYVSKRNGTTIWMSQRRGLWKDDAGKVPYVTWDMQELSRHGNAIIYILLGRQYNSSTSPNTASSYRQPHAPCDLPLVEIAHKTGQYR